MLQVHIISDSTGVTASSAARAAVALFEDLPSERIMHVFVRTREAIDRALEKIDQQKSIVVYTLSDGSLSDYLGSACRALDVPAVSLLDSLVTAIGSRVSAPLRSLPGRQYRVDQGYLDRMSAIDFAMSHDDGVSVDHLRAADVILVGVSRTSKTPTCIYLAYQGVRAANVPLVYRQDPPEALLQAMEDGVPTLGLVATPSRLSQIRKHRLSVLGRADAETYADLEIVRHEVADSRLFFDRYAIPVIDVTRRSIEETAAAVIAELHQRGVKTL